MVVEEEAAAGGVAGTKTVSVAEAISPAVVDVEEAAPEEAVLEEAVLEEAALEEVVLEEAALEVAAVEEEAAVEDGAPFEEDDAGAVPGAEDAAVDKKGPADVGFDERNPAARSSSEHPLLSHAEDLQHPMNGGSVSAHVYH